MHERTAISLPHNKNRNFWSQIERMCNKKVGLCSFDDVLIDVNRILDNYFPKTISHLISECHMS